MTTRECSKGWRTYLTSSFLILIVAVILVLVRTYFVLQENNKLSNFLNRKIVVLVNDEVLVNKNIKTDTINIYVNSPLPHVVEVIDSTSDDTVILDSSQLNSTGNVRK